MGERDLDLVSPGFCARSIGTHYFHICNRIMTDKKKRSVSLVREFVVPCSIASSNSQFWLRTKEDGKLCRNVSYPRSL